MLAIAVLLVFAWIQGRSRRNPRAGQGGGARSERQLTKRVGKAASARLIEQLRRKHPDRSRDWCADKALFDLERDRRY
jgi:hypothetical protein